MEKRHNPDTMEKRHNDHTGNYQLFGHQITITKAQTIHHITSAVITYVTIAVSNHKGFNHIVN